MRGERKKEGMEKEKERGREGDLWGGVPSTFHTRAVRSADALPRKLEKTSEVDTFE
jgi:hypothetical protein